MSLRKATSRMTGSGRAARFLLKAQVLIYRDEHVELRGGLAQQSPVLNSAPSLLDNRPHIVLRQLTPESLRQALVKQHAHGP